MSTNQAEFARLRIQVFFRDLGAEDRIILSTLQPEVLARKLILLVTRRPREGELDMFCGYHNDMAVFISLHPGMPVMVLDRSTVKERIKNSREQGGEHDQSEEALIHWPQ